MTLAPADFLVNYAEGFAQLLADPDIGAGFAWQAAGIYDPAVIGQYIAAVPTDPDRIVTLTPIPLTADPIHTGAQVDLQLRFRADADIRTVWRMRDAARAVLAGRFPMRLPTGLYVGALSFAYGGAMGQDDRKRWMWSDLWHTTVSDTRP